MAGVTGRSTAEAIERACRTPVLVVCPGYPSQADPYAFSFVHTRVQAYLRAGIDCSVLTTDGAGEVVEREFEGVRSTSMTVQQLGHLLRIRHFDTICLHFLNPLNARVIEAADLSQTRILIWCHGAESLYWERERYAKPYFVDDLPITEEERRDFEDRDAIIRRLDAMPNVGWVFVSEFCRQEARRLVKADFGRSVVIPNFIDPDVFAYHEKSPELAREVFLVRKFSDESCYAIDLAVRTVRELSRRGVFERLHFTICGAGPMHAKLLAPIEGLENVTVVDRFLTHAEIASYHANSGVALFPTRFDTQGVSMLEAASSGLAVVSTQRESVRAFLPDDCGLLCEQEDYRAYADVIERLATDADAFACASRSCHKKVSETCGYDRTIGREAEILAACWPAGEASPHLPTAPEPILTFVVADALAAGALRAVVLRAGAPVEVSCAQSLAGSLATVSTTWVKWLDPGDAVEPDGLAALVRALRRFEEADAVACAYRTGLPHTEGASVARALSGACPDVAYDADDLAWPGYGFDDGVIAPAALVYKTDLLAKAKAAGPADDGDLMSRATGHLRHVAWVPEPVWCQRVVWTPGEDEAGMAAAPAREDTESQKDRRQQGGIMARARKVARMLVHNEASAKRRNHS